MNKELNNSQTINYGCRNECQLKLENYVSFSPYVG